MVSQVHVLIIVPYALWCILNDSPERLSNPAFGWDEEAGYLHAIACGCVPTLKYLNCRTGLYLFLIGISCGMRWML